MHRVTLAWLGLVLVLPGQAAAATARVERPATGGRFPSAAHLVVVAEPGEANDIQVVVDPGAPSWSAIAAHR